MRTITLAVICALTLACGSTTPSAPTPAAPTPTPQPTPTPPAGPTFTLTGRITTFPSTPIPGANVMVMDGTNAGAHSSTDPGGSYKITGLAQGSFTLSVSADGFQSRTAAVALSSDQTMDLQLTSMTSP